MEAATFDEAVVTGEEAFFDDGGDDDAPYQFPPAAEFKGDHDAGAEGDDGSAAAASSSDSSSDEEVDFEQLADECNALARQLRRGQFDRAVPWLRHTLLACETAMASRERYRKQLELAAVISNVETLEAATDAGVGPSTAASGKKKAFAPKKHSDGALGALILARTALDWGRSEDSVPYGVIADAVAATSELVAADIPTDPAVDLEDFVDDVPLVMALQLREDDDVAEAAPDAVAETVAHNDSAQSVAPATESPQHPQSVKPKAAPKKAISGKKPNAAVEHTKSLAAFGFGTVKHETKVTDDRMFHPFVDGDRVTSARVRLWAPKDDGDASGDGVSQPPSKQRPRRITDVLNRHEIDVRGMGTPRDFDAEVVFVLWAHENYVSCELRPPYLGTWNNNKSVRLALARPADATKNLEDSPFAVPPQPEVDYDEDSGDEWDGENDEGDENLDDESERSDQDDLDDSDLEFIVPDDADESGSDQVEREENAMTRAEMRELAQRRNRRNAVLEPKVEGMFDDLPLGKHPLHQDRSDRMEYINNGARKSFIDALEYLRIARQIFESSGQPVPEELLTEAEVEAAAAKAAKEAARLAKLAAGVTVVKKAKPAVDPTGATAPGEPKPRKSRRSGEALGNVLTLEQAMALNRKKAVAAAPAEGPGTEPKLAHPKEDDDDDDIPLSALIDMASASLTDAASKAENAKRSRTPDHAADQSLEQPPRAQPLPPAAAAATV